ncbi:MAG: hypothetical protein N3A38_01595 [Planctomycetota bacterium]|nr:hypothetical protein [Planctomycetota bacterium]
MMIERLRKMAGKEVVLDTDADYIYIGTLVSVEAGCVVLENVDVHSRSPEETSKEKYIHETRKIGVRPNRRNVAVRMDRIVSVSLLEDVIRFC